MLKNIKTSFIISNLIPFNLNKVLKSILAPLIKLTILNINKVKVKSY